MNSNFFINKSIFRPVTIMTGHFVRRSFPEIFWKTANTFSASKTSEVHKQIKFLTRCNSALIRISKFTM